MNTIDFYIPDVHGRSDLLAKIVTFLQRHARSRGAEPRYTFLGDLIDRGPDSRGCLDIALRVIKNCSGSTLLLGNHEYMMLDAINTLGKSELSGTWALNGGMDTITSYMGRFDVKGVFPLLAKEYPHHVRALKQAGLYVERGGLLAVHAGIEPNVPVESQTVKNLTWIRDEFLDNVDPNARPVIHGHTIIGHRPVVTENRISIDTGSHENGRLTACIVDPSTWEVTFAQATDKGVRYIEPHRLDRGYGVLLDNPKRIFEPSPEPEAIVSTTAAVRTPTA